MKKIQTESSHLKCLNLNMHGNKYLFDLKKVMETYFQSFLEC